jgi:hypothetical protein
MAGIVVLQCVFWLGMRLGECFPIYEILQYAKLIMFRWITGVILPVDAGATCSTSVKIPSATYS